MDGFEAYKLYLALKSHFNTSYDFFKYNGKIKANLTHFNTRKDKIFFEKLAKHPDLRNFLLASFIKDSKVWVRDLAYSAEAEQSYSSWCKVHQSLTYVFKNDLSKLEDQFNDNLLVIQNQHPPLLKAYLAKDIHLETLCIILNISRAMKHWDKQLCYDPVWDKLRLLVLKYTPFIEFDKNRYKQLCLDYFVD